MNDLEINFTIGLPSKKLLFNQNIEENIISELSR